MFFRLLFTVFFILLFISCDFLSPRNSTPQNAILLDTVIDYNRVDVYPLFLNCKDYDTAKNQSQCFENEFVSKLKTSLNKKQLKANNRFVDTVRVDILVDDSGKISIYKIHESPKVLKEIPKFDSILRQSINALPKVVQPSLKRGIPVNVIFKLPIVVSLKD